MATSREFLLLCVDASLSMRELKGGSTVSPLRTAIDAITDILNQKIINTKNDEVAVVIFGTEETKNHLNQTVDFEDQYKNVYELSGFIRPSVGMLTSISEIESLSPEKHGKGDFLDALIVSIGIINERKKTEEKKFMSRIILLTDANSEISGIEDMDEFIDNCKTLDVRVEIIGINFGIDNVVKQEKSKAKIDNESRLIEMAKELNGQVNNADKGHEILGLIKTKTVRSVTVFRGPIEIGDCKILVFAYAKTKKESIPSLSKVSLPAFEKDKSASGKVNRERMYKSTEDSAKSVDDVTERISGFLYGKQIVPFTNADLEAMKYLSEKCIKVLGFTSENNISRSTFMATSDILIPQPEMEQSAIAFSALVHSLINSKSVAIVRFVKRKNSKVFIGALLPSIENGCEILYFNQLPFEEDVRHYTFTSFNNGASNTIPNKSQLDAMEDYINSLNLITPTGELAKPEETFNPTIQKFYQSLYSRALDPECPLPTLNPAILQMISPNEELFKNASSQIAKIVNLFPVKKVDPKLSSKFSNKRKYWGDYDSSKAVKLDLAGDVRIKNEGANVVVVAMNDMFSNNGNVKEVGSDEPIRDFVNMVSQGKEADYRKAVDGLKDVVYKFVEAGEAGERTFDDRALNCLLILRSTCVEKEDGKTFNAILIQVKEKYNSGEHSAFVETLKKNNVILISQDESKDVDVLKDDANIFTLKKEVKKDIKKEIVKDVNDEDGDGDIDMFDMM